MKIYRYSYFSSHFSSDFRSRFPSSLTKFFFFLALFNLWSLGMSVQADIVTWKDDQGVIHYSDKVPEGYKKQSKPVDIKNINVVSGSKVKTLTELEAAGIEITPELREQAMQEDYRREMEKSKRKKAEKEAKQKALARQQEKQLRNYQQQAAQKERAQTRKAVAEKCGRSALRSADKNRCIKDYYKIADKCNRTHLTVREQKWCNREYTPIY